MIDEQTDGAGTEQPQNDPPPISQPQEEQPIKTAENANVILAPSAVKRALPEGTCVVGRNQFEIPSLEAQIAGFDAGEKAGILVAQFPQYKFIHEKGQPLTQNAQF